MDKEFYIAKIQQLTDEKLKELLRLRTKENMELIVLAETEAIKRGIDVKKIEAKLPRSVAKRKADKGITWADVLAWITPYP